MRVQESPWEAMRGGVQERELSLETRSCHESPWESMRGHERWSSGKRAWSGDKIRPWESMRVHESPWEVKFKKESLRPDSAMRVHERPWEVEFRKESYVWRLDPAMRVHESYFSVRVGGVRTFKISAQRLQFLDQIIFLPKLFCIQMFFNSNSLFP